MTGSDAKAGEPLQLYGFWRSQATFRVRVALNLKGVAYRETPINLDDGRQNDDFFRAISPMGSVPALMVDGRTLTQSLAILDYIDEQYAGPSLLPPDALGRWRVRSLAAIAVSDGHPLIVPRVKRFLADAFACDAASWKAWQTHFFSAALRGYEASLARDPETGAFCHGDQPTIADICLAGLAAGAQTFGIEVEGTPTVDAIVMRCRSLRAFDDARAQNQVDFPG